MRPAPGITIADTNRSGIGDCVYEIERADGTTFGSIVAFGLSGGHAFVRPPVNAVARGNYAVIGGTGLFAGARGAKLIAVLQEACSARKSPGASGGPAVFHSNLSLVTDANPARPGETLIAMASGLGPTIPPPDLVDSNKPFSADEPRHAVAGGGARGG